MKKEDDALFGSEGINVSPEYCDVSGGYALSTPKQRRYIYVLCEQLGIDEDSFSCPTKDLTKKQASELIEELLYSKTNKEFGLNYNRMKDEDLPFY